MDIKIVCKQSAFKHGVTEDDIRWAFNTVRYIKRYMALEAGMENADYRPIRRDTEQFSKCGKS